MEDRRGVQKHTKREAASAVSRPGIAKAVRLAASAVKCKCRGRGRGKCKGQRQRQRQPWLSKHVLESHDGTYWTRRRYSACRTGDMKQTKFYTIRIRWLFQRVQQVTTLICRFEFQTPQWSINRSNESNQWIESMNRSKESKQWIEPMNRINEHSH